MHICRISFLLLFFLSSNLFAFGQEGGPPMFTDDARVADYKEWELNPSIQILVTDHLTLSAPHIDLNYGVLPNLQLKVEAPLLLDFKQTQSTEMSLGVLNIGIKYRFMDEEKYFISGATFPQYNFTVDKGLLIPVFFEKTIGSVLFGIANAYFLGDSNNYRYEFGILSKKVCKIQKI
ncbi:MAG TPA: hypothetical protein VLZ83_07515 [Edaphocola sp.]|nr:hypothetical protein [Edaphocola sp.]